MRDNSSTSDTPESQSRLWVAVTLSMTMIFTSYAVSVLNQQTDIEVNAQTYSSRPVVVSYLA
jgi:hypothetical protein